MAAFSLEIKNENRISRENEFILQRDKKWANVTFDEIYRHLCVCA